MILICSHSYGEYVFDHSWANAYHSYGLSYYPKLQCSIPFTPVTGPRILIRKTSYQGEVFDMLVSAMKDLAVKVYISSCWTVFRSFFFLNLDFFLAIGLFSHIQSTCLMFTENSGANFTNSLHYSFHQILNFRANKILLLL